MYLSYSEYQNMGGTLDFTTFDNYAYKAGTIINLYTYNRLKGETQIPESVKRCEFDLIQLIQVKESLMPQINSNTGVVGNIGTVASQSNDGVSVSYSTPIMLTAGEIANSYKDEVKNLISAYLNDEVNSKGEHLLYKGVYA